MFCPKCGAQIADNSTFCPSCGSAVGAPQGAAPQYTAQPQQAPTGPNYVTPTSDKSKTTALL